MVDATITLYKDIGLYPDYKRTMLFDSKTQQNDWFNSISRNLKKNLIANYNKIQNTFVLHEDVGNVYEYTYVRIKDLDSSGRTYYGFVTNVALVDEENTEFSIALDPIQTFMCEWELGECLVMREHCDRWTKNNTIPVRITPNVEPVDAYNDYNVNSTPIFSNEYMLGIMAVTYTNPYIDYDGTEVGKNNASRVIYLAIPISQLHLTQNYFKSDLTVINGDTSTTTTVAVAMPSYQDFINGAVANRLGVDPESVIGSWIVPIHNMNVYKSTAPNSDKVNVSTVNFMREKTNVTIQVKTISEYYNNIRDTAIATQEGDFGAQIITLVDMITLFSSISTKTITVEKPEKPTSATNIYSDKYEPALYMNPYRTRGIVSDGDMVLNIPDNTILENSSLAVSLSTSIGTSGIYQNIVVSEGVAGTVKRQEQSLKGSATRVMSMASDITSNAWLSYCMTQRDADRKAVQSSIISNTITNMIGMGYGGALVGSRANSGRNDELKNPKAVDSIPISKRGGFSRSMTMASVYGMATGLVTSGVQGWDMWNQQLSKESGIRNQPSKLLGIGDTISDIFDKNKDYYLFESKVDDYNYESAKSNFRYYGYIVNRVEVPNIKSRYYYNYICTLNTTIKGSLASDIKSAIATIIEKGITFFHADHCNTTEYNNYENIERALL